MKVAVTVLLQSSDGQVLVTRRPEHMRTFPNVWVPPGISHDFFKKKCLAFSRYIFKHASKFLCNPPVGNQKALLFLAQTDILE